MIKRGFIKRVPSHLYKPQHRGGKGIINIKASSRNGEVVTVKEVVDWSQPERDKFRAIARGAWEDFSKKSPLARVGQSDIALTPCPN